MIYELRSYEVDPALLEQYLAWANDRALPVLQGTFAFRMVGFWHAITPANGQVPPSNVHWMISWQSEEEMLSRWQEATSSDEWKAIAQGQPRYVLKWQRHLLKAIPRSPFQ
ncbi:MAG: NIPSNAP family protein [Chloroflexi bacterium]|nr:NIPSNAP family protein [Chloroflexota bacterium]